MKKVYLLSALAAVAMVFTSCENEKDEVLDLQKQIDHLSGTAGNNQRQIKKNSDALAELEIDIAASVAGLEAADKLSAEALAAAIADINGKLDLGLQAINGNAEVGEAIAIKLGKLAELVSSSLEVFADAYATYDDETGIITIVFGDQVFMTGDLRGSDGADGVSGIDGSNGIQGVAGIAGAQGIQGIPGIQGPAGEVGPDGATGAVVGVSAIQNEDGSVSLTVGDDSFTIPAGANGAPGSAGQPGIQGLIGLTGSAGATGTIGLQGIQGEPGATGGAGSTPTVSAVVNADGSVTITINGTDYVVAAGADGTIGVDGTDGSDGNDGADGAQGESGNDGTNGQDGSDGQNGADGDDGIDGQDGQDGQDGNDGTVLHPDTGLPAPVPAGFLPTETPKGRSGNWLADADCPNYAIQVYVRAGELRYAAFDIVSDAPNVIHIFSDEKSRTMAHAEAAVLAACAADATTSPDGASEDDGFTVDPSDNPIGG